jgi:hypothetical protein
MRVIALAALLLLASSARAETVRARLGPLEVKGIIGPMDGPVADRDIVFDRPGWVSAVSFRVARSDGKPADPAVFCHGIFLDAREGDGRYVPAHGYNFERVHLTSYIGKNEFSLPEGFGVAVDSGAVYRLEAMLRSPGVPRDGSYVIDVSYEFTPRSTAQLRTLDILRVAVRGDVQRGHGIGEFHVGPGRLVREAAFTVADDEVAHVIDFHVHRFVESVELVDAGDGRVLYRGEVLKRSDGWPEHQPVYSDPGGILLKKSGRYLFRIAYDNPTRETDLSMAAMRLFVAPPDEGGAGGAFRQTVGPLRLRGIQPSMVGPEVEAGVSFPKPGWLKGYSVRIRDSRGADADGLGLYCHSVVRDPAAFRRSALAETDGVRSVSMFLTSAEGSETVRLPDGFGVAVDTSVYRFEGVLQSPDEPHDGDYFFEVSYDFQPRGEGRELTPLTVMRVDANAPARRGHGAGEWEVPSGRHDYAGEFRPPRDAVVHMIDFHLHRYTSKVEVLDAETGRALYSADVKAGRDGYPIRPNYASREGFPIGKGRRYLFRVTYENPTDRPALTMALLFLYVSS